MSFKSFMKFGFSMALKIVLLATALFIIVRLPGKSVVNYYGYSVELNTGILVGGLIICFLFFHQFLNFWKWLRHFPRTIKLKLQARKLAKSNNLVLDAFNVMAAGDSKEALRLLNKARKFNNNDLFNDIFTAQAAYNQNDDIETERRFSALLRRRETRFLGYRGLALLKIRQGKTEDAHHFLQQALKEQPDSPWALGQLFNWNVKHRSFSGASMILEQLHIGKHLTRAEMCRKKAVLNWVKAENYLKETDFEGFYQSIHEALKLAPDLTAAMLALVNYYEESNRHSKAWKYLKKGYAAKPHPSFFAVFKQVFKQTSVLDLYQRGEELCQGQEKHPVSQWLLAKLALEAKLWGQARVHLTALKQIQPTQSCFELMAELEKREHPGNIEALQSLYNQAAQATRDPMWVCQDCHSVLPKWHAFCPSCQAFDQITWGEEGKTKQRSKKVTPILPKGG